MAVNDKGKTGGSQWVVGINVILMVVLAVRSEEHTSELQSH